MALGPFFDTDPARVGAETNQFESSPAGADEVFVALRNFSQKTESGLKTSAVDFRWQSF